ncbi:oxygen-dependent tRNA uridine(34) hydroxylase TrhO [Chryseosolibacter indicus]|uniref:tRNA uridine(34) hydroxylase n=1 Tax=Chryseosolibacter indicus TaxID=2782351 RepID=A0ABS5VXJ5_9BACT|nr:rhodanese-related sulfurtransferase [Chryseosolibacter indicus]MBT1706127.1 rhodanese-related sulfurtransferase [Chryseosolibacter indicus]
MALHNRIDSRLLKEKIKSTPQKRKTISFYKYHYITNPQEFRDILYANLEVIGVLGRIYVADEGINAQISVPEENLEKFKDYLYSVDFLNGARLNIAVEDDGKSFFKLKILVRKKIVADGLDDGSFNVTDQGAHVNAEQFNKLADDPNTIIVDMRNHYESEVGHFKGAVCPDVDTFREELQIVEDIMKEQKDKNLLMYCTGGIRCEKASAWMKHLGFKNVFQLEGGIIKYTHEVKERGLENKFVGKNFVFDERLGERITNDIIAKCHQCGSPCDDHTNCKNDGCHLLFIQCKACAEKYNGCCSDECKEIIVLPIEQQKEIRKGINKGRQVFKKGRSEKLNLKVR